MVLLLPPMTPLHHCPPPPASQISYIQTIRCTPLFSSQIGGGGATYSPKNAVLKYLEINITKEVKDLNTENYTALLNEIKEDINKWKEIPHAQTGKSWYCQDINTTQSNLQFNKTLMHVSEDIEKSILKLIWNLKGPWIAKTILEKNKVGISHFDFKTYQAYGSQNNVILA